MFVECQLQGLVSASHLPPTIYNIDLQRAHDPVDRTPLCEVLASFGILLRMIEFIHTPHNGMQIRIQLDDGELLERFNVY